MVCLSARVSRYTDMYTSTVIKACIVSDNSHGTLRACSRIYKVYTYVAVSAELFTAKRYNYK